MGNVTFRTMVGLSLAAYEAIPQYFRREKHDFITGVFESIKRGKGRFLKKTDGGGWMEVDAKKAMEKVRQQYHDSIVKPHIVQAFTAEDKLSLLPPLLYSPYDFDWIAMVEACDQELHPRVGLNNHVEVAAVAEVKEGGVKYEKGIDNDFDTLFGNIFDDINLSSFLDDEREFEFSTEIDGNNFDIEIDQNLMDEDV